MTPNFKGDKRSKQWGPYNIFTMPKSELAA